MARGDKTAYTEKQKRQAEHIEEGYERRGMSEGRAEGIAWATVNKEWGGGAKSGRGHDPKRKSSSRSSGSSASSGNTHSKRSAAAKKGWETRRARAG